MITDEELNSLGDMVEAHIQGARPVEEVQVELLWAILKELRSNRQASEQFAKQFSQVTANGNVMLTENVLR